MLRNLFLRGGTYSARLFIPLEFQSVIGRRELVRSLKTKDKRQAELMLRQLQSGFQRLFFMVRSGLIDRGQLTVILLNFVDNELSALYKSGNNPFTDGDTLDESAAGKYLTKADCYGGLTVPEQYRKLANLARRDFFVSNNKSFVSDYADVELEGHGVKVDKNSKDYSKFVEDFAHIYFLTLDEIANRLEGKKAFDYKDFVANHVADVRPVTLKDAVDEWLNNKKGSGRLKADKDSTLDQYVVIQKIILDFYGSDFPVRKLNNVELHRFISSQQSSNKIKNNTITIRAKMIVKIVDFASMNHGFPPFKYNLELKDDSANIPPLTPDELNRLFVLLSDKKKTKQWKLWIVLIGMTMGLRRSEMVSLSASDIRKTDSGIYYLRIMESKTKAGVRDVPLPYILLDFGFLNFWKERHRSKEPYLFMDYIGKAYIQVDNHKVSNWFSNLKKMFINKGSLGRLHSLRHNFADALKQGGVLTEMRNDLCGHEGAGQSAQKHYVEAYQLDLKQQAINQARWECDFSLLDSWKRTCLKCDQ